MTAMFEAKVATPLCSVLVSIPGGAAGDPLGLEGLTRHTFELSRRGAGELSREELDRELDRMGAWLSAGTGRDGAHLHGMCLERHLDRLVDILCDVLARPRMSEEEHRRLCRETSAELDELRDDDATLASRFFPRHVAPGHLYGRTALGTKDSLTAIGGDLGRVRSWHQRQVVRKNLLIGVTGALTEDRVAEIERRIRSAVPERPAPEPPDVETAPAHSDPELLLVDKPERTQSQIVFGHPILAYREEEFAALTAVDTALGGMFTSRLMQKIRVEKGWSYGCGSHLGRGRGPQWVSVDLAPAADVTAPALELAISIFRDIAAGDLTQEELDLARSYLTGRVPLSLATAGSRLRNRMRLALFGLPEDYHLQIVSRIEALTLKEAREVAARWLHPDRLRLVVVATADSVRPELEKVSPAPITLTPYDSY